MMKECKHEWIPLGNDRWSCKNCAMVKVGYVEELKEENRVLKDALWGIKDFYSCMKETIDDLSEGNVDYEDAIDEIISNMVGVKCSFEYIKNELGRNYLKNTHPTSKGE